MPKVKILSWRQDASHIIDVFVRDIRFNLEQAQKYAEHIAKGIPVIINAPDETKAKALAKILSNRGATVKIEAEENYDEKQLRIKSEAVELEAHANRVIITTAPSLEGHRVT